MDRRKLTRLIAIACIVPMLCAQTFAAAAVIGVEQYISTIDRQDTIERIHATLAREEVRSALERHGVDSALARQRVAALNDRELVQLAEDMESLPAGSGVLSTIGIVAIVILILELVGAIDIFKKV